jgi:hypothetical protein
MAYMDLMAGMIEKKKKYKKYKLRYKKISSFSLFQK